MSKEISIDLKDLFYGLCLCWKQILIGMVIFAILANTFSCYKQKSVIEQLESQSNQNTKTQDMSQYTEKLSTRQIEETKEAVETYLANENKYTNFMEYYNNSILMKIDANRVPTVTIQYYVDNDYSLEYPTIDKYNNISDIIRCYSNVIVGKDCIDEIDSEINWDIDKAYIKELISCSTNSNSQAVSSQIDNTQTLTVTILSADEQSAKHMAEIIDRKITDATADMIKSFGEFKIDKVSENYTEEANGTILKNQQTFIANLSTVRNSITSIKTALNTEQYNYYNALIDEHVVTSDTKQEDLIIPKMNYFNLKYIIIGLVIGCLLICFFYALYYILNSKLKSITDLECDYGIRTFNCLNKPNRNKLTSFITKCFYGRQTQTEMDNEIALTATTIKLLMNKRSYSNICIYSTVKSEEIEEVKQKLSNELNVIKVENKVIDNRDDEKTFIEKLSNTECIVLIEQIQVSQYSKVENTMKRIKDFEVETMGSLILR